MTILHGSQGCATYIRRYLISHFREPMDIASSNFSEETTIFGGNRNFNNGINNIISQYHPKVIAIASTCLSETIGEDVPRLISEYQAIHADDMPDMPEMLYASTPSYSGTHYEGFHKAVLAAVKALARGEGKVGRHINLFSNFISPEDIRQLKEITADFGIKTMIFPDYSDTLDSTSWDTYHRIPDGGTTVEELQRSGSAMLSIEFGLIGSLVGAYLEEQFDVVNYRLGLPVGINETDKFFARLAEISGHPIPDKYRKQRGRLVDLYIDGHKYVSNKRAVVYGEPDFVIGMASFLTEIGVKPVMIASGCESGTLHDALKSTLGDLFPADCIVGEGITFEQLETTINALTPDLKPDLMLGNSKGYYIARKLDIPLIRCGFPIHDRIGAQHQKTLCYEGATILFEQIVNALLDDKQRKSSIAYKYM